MVEFAGQVLDLIDDLPRGTLAGARIDQLARAATSIGANYEEATGAESRADFIHKMQLALKESREACYWLGVIARRNVVPRNCIEPTLQESLEIRAMLTAAVITAKKNRNGNAERKTVNG